SEFDAGAIFVERERRGNERRGLFAGMFSGCSGDCTRTAERSGLHLVRGGTKMVSILRRRLSLHLAAWFGLLTGVREVTCLGVQKFLLRQPIYFGLHIIWMSPLANLCLFTLLGLLLSSLRITSLRVKASVMAFFALLGLALVFEGVKFYAVVSLAAGVAWRARLLAAACARSGLTLSPGAARGGWYARRWPGARGRSDGKAGRGCARP